MNETIKQNKHNIFSSKMFHKQNIFITLCSNLMGEPLHIRDNNTDKALLQQEKAVSAAKTAFYE